MLEFYVDCSYQDKLGSAIAVISAGTVHCAKKVGHISSAKAEMLALIEAFKLAKAGDTIHTDQLGIVDQLLIKGFVADKYVPQAKELNNLLQTKGGIVINYLKSHSGDKYSNLADHLAKVTLGIRNLDPNSELNKEFNLCPQK